MEIQRLLGSDIVMCFDECPALPADRARIEESMRLSMRWAARSRDAFGDRPGHALFGIQQGGLEQDLRGKVPRRCARLNLTATPSVVWPWARGKRRCFPFWITP